MDGTGRPIVTTRAWEATPMGLTRAVASRALRPWAALAEFGRGGEMTEGHLCCGVQERLYCGVGQETST